MRKKVLGSAGMCAVGAALLAAAVMAGPAASSPTRAKAGGTLNIAHSAGDFDNLDPAIAYVQDDWAVEYITCLKLLNTPDKGPPEGSNLVPDAATGFPVVSKDGKTYTFTIKPGFKFNTGAPVTAANFKAAFDRDSDPAMNSPVTAFIDDVVGVKDVLDKKSKSVSGVIAKGMKLTIKLTHPDGGLLNKLALPFFCAIPVNLPHDPNGIQTPPSAGPYYIASRIPNRQVVLKKNPNYHGTRPRGTDTIVITVNTDQQQTVLQVRNGTYAYDMGAGPPPADYAQLAKDFGVNKSRFFVNQQLTTWYLALNAQHGATANTNVRKAINYAIDRPALTRTFGYLGGKRTTQLLPAALAGGNYKSVYPIRGADPAKAKSLAPNCGNISLWTTTSANGQAVGQLTKFELTQMGCNVTIKPFQGSSIYTAAGTKGADFDVMRAGWIADYPDPYDFYHLLLDGTTIVEQNNTNFSYFNNASVNAQIAKYNLYTGQERLKAYGALDLNVMKNYAPIAAYTNSNNHDFISGKVTGYVYAPFIGMADLATFKLK